MSEFHNPNLPPEIFADYDCAGGVWFKDRQRGTTRFLKHIDCIPDLTCVLKKKVRRGLFTVTDTVICGRWRVEDYLRQGYSFDWNQTDASRAIAAQKEINNGNE